MNNKLENEVKIMSLEGNSILKNNSQRQEINKIYNINFNKSLLLNKLIELGLNVSKNSTTRDIINVRFSYGYDIDVEKIEELEEKIKELKEINKDSVQADKNYSVEEVENRRLERKKHRDIIKELEKKIKELKLSKEAVREQLYENGFFLDFYKVKKHENKKIVRDENGGKVRELDERIHYVYWFRTSAKAKIGDVFFINKELVDKINVWQQMGIQFEKNEKCKLVEMEAYKSLTASSLEGLIRIDARKEILVIDDLDSFSTHKCKLVKADENDNCYVEDDDNYRLKNTLFDGQSLISSDLMQGNELTRGKAGVLLRGHFFKSFALNTNISKFMKDYFGEEYETAYITDRYGRDIKVADIRLITTENSMKWDGKFDTTMDDWVNVIEADNNLFGIVKTEKESKYGDLQRVSYQMLNSLDPQKVNIDNVLKDTLEYTKGIKNNIDSYIEYLDTTKNDMNANQMLIDLYNRNNDIVGTELFRNYKKYQIRSWKDRLRAGKLLVNGDNLVIIGNPYTMLLHAVGQVKHINNVLDSDFVDESLGQGNTCYTTRFIDKEELALFRSPHNAQNNIYCAINTRSNIIDKYFNFTDNIIACNLINTDFQDRLNGSDQDSDFVLTTNQIDIVNFAKECQKLYPTIRNCIKEKKRQYKNNMKSMSIIDNALAKGKADIGITSNIAQIALSWYMDSKDEALADVICIASVCAQVAIDNSKREYSIDLEKQIANIRKQECMQMNIEYEKINKKIGEIEKKIGKAKPSFWQYTDKDFKKKDLNKLLKVNCFMCLLQDKIDEIGDSDRINNIDINTLLDTEISNKYKYEQIQSILDKYKDYKKKDLDLINKIKNTKNKEFKTLLVEQQKNNLKRFNIEISKLKINTKNMKALVKKFIENKNKDLHIDFLNILYKNNKEVFLKVFVEDKKGVNQKIKWM